MQPDASGRSAQREGDLELPLPEIDIDYRSMDDRYRDIAEEIPGFGGLFVDEDILQVYLQPDAFMNVAGGNLPFGEVLRLEEMPRLQESLVTHLGEQILERADNGVVVLQGEYDYRDLLAWRAKAHELVFGGNFIGLSILDVDESLNKVMLSLDYDWREELGLPRDIPEDVLQEELGRLEIPVDAVAFDYGSLMQTTQTLNMDIIPSPVGGIRIYRSDTGESCSLGFNAVLGSTKGFITASHCTKNRFNPDTPGQLAEFEQRNGVNPDFLMGRELYDVRAWSASNPPPASPNIPSICGNSLGSSVTTIQWPYLNNGQPYTGGPWSFQGCRRADAAFIRYSTQSTLQAVNFGQFAFPSPWQLPLNYSLDPKDYPKPYSQTRYDSTAYNPPNIPMPSITLMDNQTTVQKVGISTGRTLGTVRKVDADFYLLSGGVGVVLHLGGFIVEPFASQPKPIVLGGDSGEPVFYHQSGDSLVDLLGIVVGQFDEPAVTNDPNHFIMGASTLQHIGEEMQDASGHTLRVSN